MLYGVACDQSYDGPPVDAIEFRLHEDQATRVASLNRLRPQCKSLSAHLPSYMNARDMDRELYFDDGRVDYFVSHVTKHTPYANWRDIPRAGKRILFENHNQDVHPTDAGWCTAAEFMPVVDAGHSLCLDTGHILYSCMMRGRLQDAEHVFEEFLELPIAAVHVHTLGPNAEGIQVDHMLDGYDIGPWIRAIEAKFPDVVLMVETGYPQFSAAQKLAALQRWRGIA